MDSKIQIISLAVCFYVIGQVLIKLDNNRSPVRTTCYLTISTGLIGALVLCREWKNHKKDMSREGLDLLAILAGIFVFLGNLYWVKGIKSGIPLGHLRLLLTGLEVIFLLLVGYIYFKEDCLDFRHIIGMILVLMGVFLIVK